MARDAKDIMAEIDELEAIPFYIHQSAEDYCREAERDRRVRKLEDELRAMGYVLVCYGKGTTEDPYRAEWELKGEQK